MATALALGVLTAALVPWALESVAEKRERFERRGVEVEAKAVDVDRPTAMPRRPDGNRFVVEVAFRTAEGQPVTTTVLTRPHDLTVGDTLAVVYDEADPTVAAAGPLDRARRGRLRAGLRSRVHGGGRARHRGLCLGLRRLAAPSPGTETPVTRPGSDGLALAQD